MQACRTEELFALSHTLAAPLLARFPWPWQALDDLADFLLTLGESLPAGEYDSPAPGVWVAKTARVAPTAFLGAPCIVGPGAEVRHCAFIRGAALVGAGAVVGNSVELKNCILFNGAQAPHFNYIGDSILGHKAHLGAGAVTSNLKSDKSPVVIRGAECQLATGRKKLGALVGDGAEVGCNSVLCPGAVLGKNSQVYPTSCVRGVVPAGHIFKGPGLVVKRILDFEGRQ